MENVNNSGHILNKDHSPSFFQNSCMGNVSEEEKTVGEIPESVDRDRANEYVNARPLKVEGEIGWVKTLKCFPMLKNEIFDNHLIKGSSTVNYVCGFEGPALYDRSSSSNPNLRCTKTNILVLDVRFF